MVELSHKSLGSVKSEKKEAMSNVDLQSLIELGSIKDSITIGKIEFVLRSLSASENIELQKNYPKEPTEEQLFDLNLRILAMSIDKVNGQDLETLHPDKSRTDKIEKRIEILAAMQNSVLNELLAFFIELKTRSNKDFGVDQVKNSQRGH